MTNASDTSDTMTSTSLTSATSAADLASAERAAKAARLEALEREGLQLITSADLDLLRIAIKWHAKGKGRADLAEIESRAVGIMAILFAKYGEEDRKRIAFSASKKAWNRVAASSQVGRVRAERPTDPERYTSGANLSATHRAAVMATAKASNLAPIGRGYAHNARTLRTSAEGAEGMSAAGIKSEALRVALDATLGAATVDALHAAYVAEVRTTRKGKANAIGTIKRSRSIAWKDAAPEGIDRSTFRYRVQVAAKRAEALAKSADVPTSRRRYVMAEALASAEQVAATLAD